MDVINYFREDVGEILGVYFDDEKIFFARLANEFEIFETDFNPETAVIEQLAEKIKTTCNQKNWQISKVGLILREGTAATYQTEFKNIPANEVENAVRIWAVAHVGKNSRYTSIKRGEEIWMEALNEDIVQEYISAFEKNSMTLCAITEIPQFLTDDERILTPFNRAVFATDLIKNKKSPNLLPIKISTWNLEKISLTATVIFFIVLLVFSAKTGYDYYTVSTLAETAQERFNSQGEQIILKNDLDAVKAEIRQFDKLISAQNINFRNFNALIKIGKIYESKIILDKVKANGETFELEGVAESPNAVKIYLSRLKNFVSPQVKLKNATELEGQIIFSISVTF